MVAAAEHMRIHTSMDMDTNMGTGTNMGTDMNTGTGMNTGTDMGTGTGTRGRASQEIGMYEYWHTSVVRGHETVSGGFEITSTVTQPALY